MISNQKTVVRALVALVVLVALTYFANAHLLAQKSVNGRYLLAHAGAVGALAFIVSSFFLSRIANARLKAVRSWLRQSPAGQGLAEPKVGWRADELTKVKADLEQLLDVRETTDKQREISDLAQQDKAQQRIAELAKANQVLSEELAGVVKAQNGLRQSAELVAKTFETVPVALAALTVREGCFIEANDRFLRLLGYERDDLLNHSDRELNIWEKAGMRDELLANSDNSASGSGVECRLRTKLGELRGVVASLAQTTIQGTPCLMLAVHDTANRSRLEMQLFQSQKMEAVGQLAAGLSHDFNNILMIVQGYTSLLMADTKLEKSSHQALERVSVAADRAAHLTRQLLAFSRKQVIHARRLDLNETIHGMAKMLQEVLGDKISLQLGLGHDVPSVEADPAMIQEAIMNLSLNARDALGKGGELFISTAAVQVDAAQARENADARKGYFTCLSIRDTGCGMEPSVLSHVFEPFFTTKGVGKGTGLGLATVYGIVKQHNGWIEVASQPGQGTIFRIFLQAVEVAMPQPSVEAPPALILSGKERVLVVEDEPGLRALVEGILRRYGYDVVTAGNGVEALQVWDENETHVDLLLTDMVMPEGMTGRELAEKLRAKQPDLKVIFTSGYSVDVLGDDLGEFVDGVNFLQKPYRPQSLAETVRRSLSRPRESVNT